MKFKYTAITKPKNCYILTIKYIDSEGLWDYTNTVELPFDEDYLSSYIEKFNHIADLILLERERDGDDLPDNIEELCKVEGQYDHSISIENDGWYPAAMEIVGIQYYNYVGDAFDVTVIED